MFIDYGKYLTGFCQLRRTSMDADGMEIFTFVSTVNCLHYFGNVQRGSAGHSGQELFLETVPRQFVLIPGEYLGSVKNGDSLYNVVDADQNQILVHGIIEERSVYRHWGYGPQIVQCRINERDN